MGTNGRAAMAAALGILSAAGLAWTARAADPAARPNILLILADDLGWSDLGCYGGEIRTPTLDGLAANGLRFTQFYNGARCCPSRASLMTGLYPHQAGVGDMTGDRGPSFPGYRGTLQPDAVTIAEVLGAAGYRTFMVGKWHLHNKADVKPTDRGFEEFYGMLGGYNTFWKEDPHYTRWPAGRSKRDYAPGAFYSTDVFADYALDFIADGRRSGKPWFLYLAFNAPHFPLHAPEADAAAYEAVYARGWDAVREARLARQKEMGLVPADLPLTPRSTIPANWANEKTGWAGKDNPPWDSLPADRRADLARRMAVYAGMVDRMDQAIGRVVADLRARGDLDNTLIFFLSDNGACAEWDPFGFDVSSGPNNILHTGDDLKNVGGPDSYISYGSGWANACNTPWRLYKHYGHEGGISTPLVVHWPAGVKAKGELRPQPGHLVDIMATCVDVAGAAYPKQAKGVDIQPMEGRSLRPAFDGKPVERDLIAWEHEGNRAIREGDWKLVSIKGGPWELYDLRADRVELRDLAPAQPERVTAMAGKWEAWAKRCRVIAGDEGLKRGARKGAEAPRRTSAATTFDLKAGAELQGGDAPDIAGKTIRLDVEIAEPGRDGVLVAQGGDQHGFALYFKDGDLFFAVRRNRKLESVRVPAADAKGAAKLEARLSADGTASVSVDGRERARGSAGGLVAVTPKDGLQVGRDELSAAGDYDGPFPFSGRIGRVRVTLGKP